MLLGQVNFMAEDAQKAGQINKFIPHAGWFCLNNKAPRALDSYYFTRGFEADLKNQPHGNGSAYFELARHHAPWAHALLEANGLFYMGASKDGFVLNLALLATQMGRQEDVDGAFLVARLNKLAKKTSPNQKCIGRIKSDYTEAKALADLSLSNKEWADKLYQNLEALVEKAGTHSAFNQIIASSLIQHDPIKISAHLVFDRFSPALSEAVKYALIDSERFDASPLTSDNPHLSSEMIGRASRSCMRDKLGLTGCGLV